MNVPGPPALALLAYLLVFLPYAAFKSARRLHAIESGASSDLLPTRSSVWISTSAMLATLLAFSWWVGDGFGFRIFAVRGIGVREILAASGALLSLFALRALTRRLRTDEERRKLVVYKLAPRDKREWILWTVTVLLASVAEEAAYRGVALQTLWDSLGNPWIAALLCSLAFAAAHCVQGVKSVIMIFAVALVMHALVAFTRTLVLAMLVHAVYDLVAGWQIRKEADVFLRQDAALSAKA
ncbi:MAG TPA: CPBP family intramembrane glutamic endopeptidase [Planctomycetota bacterium]|nr:CPBP family intramembrane glutamic endopeptidase [Planctomycetota bacterium]